jgi:hypothetical protein
MVSLASELGHGTFLKAATHVAVTNCSTSGRSFSQVYNHPFTDVSARAWLLWSPKKITGASLR